MPLRSVEAATRDDAIAAAREQFGPAARVVGVRRVRSGGVLGFFATERYVAEVDPDHPARAAGRERESARSSAVQASERAAAARRAEAEAARSGDRLNELTGLLGRDGAEPSVPTYSRSIVARSAPRDVPEAGAAEPAPFDAAWFDAFRAETARTASQRTDTAQPTATRPASGRLAAPRSDAFRPEAARAEPFRSEPLRAEQSRPAAARSVQTRAGSTRIEPARFQPARLEPEWAETPATRTGFPRSSTAPEPEPAPVSSVRLRAGAVDAAPAPWSFAAAVLGETGATTVKDGDGDAPDTGESPPPSPFTAALARMVSGDRDVRQAVQAALDDRAAVRSANDDARPMRSRTAGSATTSAKTGAEHQKEEPVTEQDSGSPSLGAEVRSAGTPTWAAEAAPAAQSVSRREEAIAEVLRDALDQGHSDEALADILRKVLASTAPHVDLPVEPVEDPGLLVPAQPRSVASPAVEESSWRGPSRPLWGDSEQASSSWSTVAADDVELPADAPIWAEVVLREPSPAEQRRDRAAEEAAAARAAEEAAAARAAEEAAAARAAEEAAAARAAEEAAFARAAEEEAAARAAEEAAFARAAEEAAFARAAEEEAAARAAEEAAFARAAEEAAAVEEERAAITTVASLARTASDPAPLPLDATSVMPPLSLLPPLPGSGRRGGGLPPVPPATSRPSVPPAARPAAASAQVAVTPAESAPVAPAPAAKTLATVFRLPVPPMEDTVEPVEDGVPPLPSAPAGDAAESRPAPAAWPVTEPATSTPAVTTPAATTPAGPTTDQPSGIRLRPTDVVGRLRALGIPELLLGPAFVAEADARGTYAALTRALGTGLPMAPEVPDGAGEVLFVVGPGVDTLRAARALAASLRLDPDRVQWATRGELAGLAPQGSRMTTIEAAIDRRSDALAAGTLTIVAVDAPLRTDAYWMAQMLAIWSPAAVWAVVDATRKPEDVEPWIDGLPRVDALMVQDSDLSADPAAVLDRIAVPVALLDGIPATPHRWASLLCERLEKLQG